MNDILKNKLDKVANAISKVLESLAKELAYEEKRIAKDILKIIQNLKTDAGGNIRITKGNLALIEKIKEKLLKFKKTPAFQRIVAKYAAGLGIVAKEINAYYAATISKFNAENTLYRRALAKGAARMRAELVSSGVSRPVARGIAAALRPNKKTGLIRKVDLEKRVEKLMLDKDGGVWTRYVTRIAHDAIYMQARDYEKTLTQDLGFKWFLYSGSAIKTSRKFCKDRHDKFFHINEVLSWNKMNWDGKKTAKYGKVDIFVDCGGFNCRHLLSGVAESSVPESAKNRALMLGFLK